MNITKSLPQVVANLAQLLHLLRYHVQLRQLSHHHIERLNPASEIQSIDKIDNVLSVGDEG